MTGKTVNRYSPEIRARAVRMVLDHEKDHASRWAAVVSISAKIGLCFADVERVGEGGGGRQRRTRRGADGPR